MRAWTGGEPSDLAGSYLAVARPGPTHPGSTLPVIGARELTTRPSGLLVPTSARASRQPIDLIGLVISSDDVGLGVPTLEEVAAELARCPLGGTVKVLVQLLVQLKDPQSSRREVELTFAAEAFSDHLLAQLQTRIKNGEYLFTAHNILTLIGYALRHCYAEEDGEPELASLAWMALALNEHLGTESEISEPVPDLGLRIDGEPNARASVLAADMVANQYFNAELDIASLVARFQRRWRELPAEDLAAGRGFDLDGIYRSLVGVPLGDLINFATVLWGVATQGSPVLDPVAVQQRFSWPREQLDAVLRLLARDRHDLLQVIDDDEFAGTWSFNAFERFPILLLDSGEMVVINPEFVMNRVYGWLPILDIAFAMKSLEESVDAAPEYSDLKLTTVVGYLRSNTERYVLEVLEAIAPRRGIFKRLWDENELIAAYPRKKGDQVCDAVVEEADAWVAFEVSSRQVQRRLVAAASPQALLEDVVRGVVAKAKQLEATLSRLRDDESMLTGRPRIGNRRFVPVLVISEGFPLGPVTRAVIDERLRLEGVLQDPELRPLHIMGVDELELIEQAVTMGGRTLVDLLDAHASSSLAQMNLKNFLHEHLGGHYPSDRQMALWRKALDITTAAIT